LKTLSTVDFYTQSVDFNIFDFLTKTNEQT